MHVSTITILLGLLLADIGGVATGEKLVSDGTMTASVACQDRRLCALQFKQPMNEDLGRRA